MDRYAKGLREVAGKDVAESLDRLRSRREYRAEMPMHLLREAREMTQVHLAKSWE